MSVDGHHCRQLGPCYGHLEHFILVHIPSMILIYVRRTCFPVFALCHNGTGVLQFIPSLTNDSVCIYSMIRKLHVVGNPGLAGRQILKFSVPIFTFTSL